MFSIPANELLGRLPASRCEQAVDTFVAPMAARMPGRCLHQVVSLAVRGILGGQTPVITAMA